MQVNLGHGPRQGNFQLYLSRFRRERGNRRLNIGDGGRLKAVRRLRAKFRSSCRTQAISALRDARSAALPNSSGDFGGTAVSAAM